MNSETDNDKIIELKGLFEEQKKAFEKNMYPSYKSRVEKLKALASMIKKFRRKIEEALNSDFESHPKQLVTLCEVMPPIERINYALANLKSWMKPKRYPSNILKYGLSKVYVLYQPVGVVGNMSPWNFPVEIAIGPLVDILAAGNRAIVKPSELAPASAELVKEMLSVTFERNQAAAVTGGVQLAKEFTSFPWDHLVYTGGPTVARLVMKAAAENLTPVTLELGGKCPAIIAPDSVDEKTITTILATKNIKSGQMCITIDYVFVPEAQLEKFITIAQNQICKLLPSYENNTDVTGIINKHHLNRLIDYVEDAKQKGVRVIEYPSKGKHMKKRRHPFTFVINPDDNTKVMQNEIFGPILPIKTYNKISDVIQYVNSHDRPLALYVNTKNHNLSNEILKKTISGGACVNSASIHASIQSLPFGGIGNSGMGRHHGYEGFLSFSHQKSIFEAGIGFMPKMLYPPYGASLERILNFFIR